MWCWIMRTRRGWRLRHLYDLGHRRIVYMKGQTVSTDTELRWSADDEGGAGAGAGD